MDKRGVEPSLCGLFADKVGGRSVFHDFVRTSFRTAHYSNLINPSRKKLQAVKKDPVLLKKLISCSNYDEATSGSLEVKESIPHQCEPKQSNKDV